MKQGTQERTDKTYSWTSPKLRLLSTGSEPAARGRGVFATERIAAGETLAIFGGFVWTLEEYRALPVGRQHYLLQVEDGFFLGNPDPDNLDASDFFNHSCAPNSGIKGSTRLEALRGILPGEEVVFDYAMCATIPLPFDTCLCGTPYCRGKPQPDDWRRADLQERYAGHFSHYIEEKILSARAGGSPHAKA